MNELLYEDGCFGDLTRRSPRSSVNMMFNMGRTRLSNAKMHAQLTKEDWKTAAIEGRDRSYKQVTNLLNV